MTQIIRTESINGGDITQEVVNRLSTLSISVSPKEICDYLHDKYGDRYAPYNSVVLFDAETKYIYGFILAHTLNISNADIVFRNQPHIMAQISSPQCLGHCILLYTTIIMYIVLLYIFS